MRRQADGVEIIERAGSPQGVALLSDFFHMHIEETDTPAAFRQAGRHVAHVHMADNTRMQPGTGDIGLARWLTGPQGQSALAGYLAYECGIAGERREALKKSVQFVRETISQLD